MNTRATQTQINYNRVRGRQWQHYICVLYLQVEVTVHHSMFNEPGQPLQLHQDGRDPFVYTTLPTSPLLRLDEAVPRVLPRLTTKRLLSLQRAGYLSPRL